MGGGGAVRAVCIVFEGVSRTKKKKGGEGREGTLAAISG